MKLVNIHSGKTLIAGQTVHSFRGEVYTLDSWTEPLNENSTGRVHVRQMGSNTPQSFYPGVFNAEWRFDVGDQVTVLEDEGDPAFRAKIASEYKDGAYGVYTNDAAPELMEVPSTQVVKYFS